MVQILVKLPGDETECKEWAIVELQGDLETRHPVPLSGKFIGDLHFAHKDAPVLIIGHHILHGKVMSLEKPFAVITKASNSETADGSEVTPMEADHADQALAPTSGSEDNPSQPSYHVKAIIRKKVLFKTRPKPIIAHVPKKL
ncbi:chromosome transmission fidelity protein 8 homolog [Aplysia californica]|uniref:Chromosome transmission fidelity protein 8 homolog n=1 Tax=Aplysia californica TaxID=6500 RepID=A0ABM0JUG9_APLCA|nr:chromosome transmission fidelity protein 8 homolog [Aplysia californica]XP_005101777.1 chromosome transmission fidelity protein 8 homolog [Aplysia californica]XP_012939928.1 chromosome transmission fidelity protein 8 homolog [Aplysia californica]